MNSVDNRVVVLTFDNKDFERNVQTSLGTLEKLKHGLKFQGATDGLAKISATAKSFSLAPMGDAIESIRSRFSNLGIIGMTVIQNLTNKVTDFATRVGSQIFTGGITRAKNLEQANFMLEGLFSNAENKAEKVKEIMDAANEAVSGTAYGLDEAAKVASQLVASGIKDGDKMTFVLKGIAGTAAMTGGSYSELGHIFTTVAGQGKLMTEQLRMFEGRGLNVAATLAEQLNTTEAEIREMVHDGTIDFETFANAMANAFGEHAQEANKTFAGSLSNVRAALSRLGAKVATPQLVNLKDIFNVLAPLIDRVSEALQPLIDLLNNKLHAGAMKAVDALTKIFLVLGGDVDKLRKKTEYASDEAKEHIENMIASYTGMAKKIGGEFEETAETVEQSADSISHSAEEIDEMAQRVISGEFGNGEEVRRQQLEALGYSFEEVQNKVNEMLDCSYRYDVEQKELITTTEEAVKQNGELADSINEVNEKQTTARNIFSNLKETVSNVWQSLKDFASAFKQGVVNAFSGQGSKFLRAVERISMSLHSFSETIKLDFKGKAGLEALFTGIFTVIREIAIGALKVVEIIVKIATVIAKGVRKVLEFVGAWYLVNKEMDKSSRLTRFFEALKNVISKVGDVLVAFKDKIKSVLAAVKETEGFKHLQESLSRIWETIKDIAGKVFDKIIDKMNAFGQTKVDMSWLDKVVDFLGKGADKFASFIDMISGGIPKIKEFFSNFKGPNISSFTDFVKSAKASVSDFFSGTESEGGKQKLGVINWLKQIITDALSGVGEFFSGISTSGFVDGIKTFVQKVISIFDGADQDKVLEILTTVGTIIAKLVLFVSTVKTLKSIRGALDSIGGAFQSIGDFFTGLKDTIQGYVRNKQNMEKAKLMILGLATIVASLWIISKIPQEDLARSAEALVVIIGSMIGVFALIGNMPVDSNKLKGFATSMVGLGIGLLAMIGAAKIVSKMSKEEFKDAAIRVGVFVGEMAVAARIAGQVKAGAAFMGLAVALNLLLIPIKVLGKMSKSDIKKSAIAVGVFVAELAIAARIAGTVKAAAAFMGLALAVDLLVPALLILGKAKWETILKGAGTIGAIVLSLAASARIAGKSKGAATTFLAMTVPLAAAIAGLYILKDIPAKVMITNAAALSGVMLSLAAAFKLCKGGSKGAENMLKMTVPLLAAIAGLAVLAQMPVNAIIASAAALSGIMLSLAAAFKLCKGGGKGAEKMLQMVLPLGAAVAALYFLKDGDWQAMLAGGAGLSAVLLAMAGALKIASGAKADDAAAMDLMIVALIGAAASIAIIAQYDWQSILAAALGLSAVIVSCGGMLALFSTLQINAAAAVSAGLAVGLGIDAILACLVAFVSLLGVINDATGGGALAAIQQGKEILIAVGEAIGGFIGSIAATVVETISAVLPQIGQDLADFATNAKPFFDSIGGIDVTVLEGIKNLAAALLCITAGELIDQIFKVITGGSSLSVFGEELAAFGAPFARFAADVAGIDESSVTGAATAIKVVAEAAKELPNEGGVVAYWAGDNTLSTFAAELELAGPALKSFADSVNGINTEQVTAAANSAKAIAEFAHEIPNEGGELAYWVGDNKLSTFAEELMAFGPSMKSFADSVNGINTDQVEAAANSASVVAKFAQEIPNEGGVLAMLMGDNLLSTFGKELAAFGPYFASFADSVKGVDGTAVANAASAASTIAAFANEIPNQGLSVVSIFVGDNTLSKFGKELAAFGPYLTQFAESIKGISVAKMYSVAQTMPSLVGMSQEAAEGNYEHFQPFGEALETFGEKLKDYYDDIKGVSTAKITSVIKSVYDLINVGGAMADVETSAMADFGNALKNIGNTGVDEFVSALENSSSTVASAVMSMVHEAASGASDTTSFYYIGINMGQGMINGLADSSGAIMQTAANIANAAVTTIRNCLQIFSPSRVMHQLGEYAGLGLANGLKDKTVDVERRSEQMADTIIETAAKPIEQLQNAINSGIDFEPVVTPVLDLTNFNEGAASIGSLLGPTEVPLTFGGMGATALNTVLSLADLIGESRDSQQSVVDAIGDLRSDVVTLGERMSRLQVMLDGQTLVGEIIDPIDQELGSRMELKQRGLY